MTDIAVPFFLALPASPPPWPGIVVVMEGDGMKPQLLRVCERLAAEGYAVAAPDLYWRFGGSRPDAKDRDAAGAMFGRLQHAGGRALLRRGNRTTSRRALLPPVVLLRRPRRVDPTRRPRGGRGTPPRPSH